MPPQGARAGLSGAPRPQTDRTRSTRRLDAAAAAHPNPGRPVLHRLNRAEYANAIRDLLGLDVDVTPLLPPDDSAFGFDNVAEALNTSPALLQAYLSAARKISTVAVGDPRVSAGSDTYSVRPGPVSGRAPRRAAAWHGRWHDRLAHLPGGRRVRHPDQALSHQLERHSRSAGGAPARTDARRQAYPPREFGGDEDLVAVQANPTAASDGIETERRLRVFVKSGRRQLGSAFLEETSPRLETNRLQRFVRDFNPYDAEGASHIQSITHQGPVQRPVPGTR